MDKKKAIDPLNVEHKGNKQWFRKFEFIKLRVGWKGSGTKITWLFERWCSKTLKKPQLQWAT
jgi:hypothetical protein